MSYQICFAPGDWPGEIAKVTRAYRGRADTEIIQVGYDIVKSPYYKLAKPKDSETTVASVSIKQIREKLETFSQRTFADHGALLLALKVEIGDVRGSAIAATARLPYKGRSTINAATIVRLRFAIQARGELPSHVRWFGHGNKGCVIGAEKTYLNLDNLVKILTLTQTPILSFYCCETGALLPNGDIGSYRKSDAPTYLLNQFHVDKRYSLGMAVVVINSNKTENMWSDSGMDRNLDFPGERHTYVNAAGIVADCSEGEAKVLRLYLPNNLRSKRGLGPLFIDVG